MKLLFAGIRPGRGLLKSLKDHGFVSLKEIPFDSAFSHTRLGPGTAEIIVVSSPKQLPSLRKKHPEAWIVLLVKPSELSQKKILESQDKNALWIKTLWERTFWHGIQEALNHLGLKKERDELYLTHQEMMSRSKKLVEQFQKDLALASKIQRALLPKSVPEIPGISFMVKYIPSEGLGGDYYDIFEFGDKRRFGILMADSRTHGLAAALLSGLVKVRLEEMKDRFPNSRSFVEYLNTEIQQVQVKPQAGLSLLYGVLDRTSLSFHFTVAGDFKPLLWRAGKPVSINTQAAERLGNTGTYVFREQQISLQPGDTLILHTDGLHAPLGSSSLEKILKTKEPDRDPLEIQNELLFLIDKHREEQRLEDDITVIQLSVDDRILYIANAR